MTDHIGIYDVPEIKSIVEQTDYGPSPYTYVTLSLLEDWHNAPTPPIARVEGGEMIENGERITSSWSVSIRREKNVILLVSADPAQNNGYYYLHPLRVFPIDQHQMVRNSTWFGKESIPLSELQDLIKKAQEYSGPLEDCPYLNRRKKEDNEPRDYQEPESDEEYIILEPAD